MTIELTSQVPIEDIFISLRKFKRTGETIGELIRENRIPEAILLLNEEDDNITTIERMLRKYEQGYINPQTAKKIMMIRKQFKDERERVARELHRAREQASHRQSQQQKENLEEQMEGFDFQVQSRLMKEKGQSLMLVHKKFNDIQEVVKQTHEMTIKQGQNLDLVSDDLQRTRSNVSAANQHLEEANTQSKQKSRCCWWLLLAFILILCVVCIFLLFF